jgi:hypothetical protein
VLPDESSRDDHRGIVIALTSPGMRNTRCTLLLLMLTGGRVMGSNDQMTLRQAFGPPICAAELNAKRASMALADAKPRRVVVPAMASRVRYRSSRQDPAVES